MRRLLTPARGCRPKTAAKNGHRKKEEPHMGRLVAWAPGYLTNRPMTAVSSGPLPGTGDQAAPGGRTNLREPATTFLGRRTELAHLDSLLASGFVTVLGPAGCGK